MLFVWQKGLYLHEFLRVVCLAERSVPARNLPCCVFGTKVCTCTKSAVLCVWQKGLYRHEICRVVCLEERSVSERNLPCYLFGRKAFTATKSAVLLALAKRSLPARYLRSCLLRLIDLYLHETYHLVCFCIKLFTCTNL